MCKYLEINSKYIFPSIANLKCTLQTGKCTPRDACTPGWEPLC